jgi:glyoxylase-like metal-dependent hydrolase (beta-lactamase superfamily II)
MIFRQIVHPATGCASYIFGCTSRRALAVVDPHAEHIADYLAIAQAADAPIRAIVETHVQEEFIAFMLEGLPAPPPEHARIRAANRRGDVALPAQV